MPSLRVCALVCAVLVPFIFFMTGFNMLAMLLVFQLFCGICNGCAFYIFCFALNNAERLLGMFVFQFYGGFVYYLLWNSIPSAAVFIEEWGGAIGMALYLAIVFCCPGKIEEKRRPDEAADSSFSFPVFLVLLLGLIHYMLTCTTNYIDNDGYMDSVVFGIGAIISIALVYVIHITVSRSAMYSWMIYLILSLLGMSILQFKTPAAISLSSFTYGLGNGIGYIVIFFMCAGAIKQSKSLKMFRLACCFFFFQYCFLSGLAAFVYAGFPGQSNILTFALVVAISCIWFMMYPYLQRNVFEAPWTDGLKLADMPEYESALAETEQLDNKERLGLSTREKEIFTLLLTEASQQQIADTLKISISVIDFHLNSLYRKLGMQPPKVQNLKTLPRKPLLGHKQIETAKEKETETDWRKMLQANAVEPLMDGELEVARFIMLGYKNSDISTATRYTLNTVKSYRKELYSKLGIHEMKELFVKARKAINN
jgi:DNA-binding NarL/FixJ family response regulator